MSRFLKFIVHFVVICTVLCVVALVAPPFWGITTVIVDNAEKESNLPLGSVTYAIPIDTQDAEIGTPILVQQDGKTYRYNIASLDLENGTGTVTDPSSASGETIPVSVKTKVPKVAVTIGLLGYLFVAAESIEGLIILGLIVLFLVILYIIAELWKKEPEEREEDEEEDDTTYIKSKKELRKEEKERARRIKAEDKQMLREEKLRKKQEKKDRKIIRTGGFVDEVYEDDFEDDEPEEEPVTAAQSAASEAHELLKKEIAATTADELPEEEAPEEPEPEPVKEEPVKEAEEPEPEPAEIKKMAIPLWTAAELADKAKKDGDAPDIVKDDITKVTLFDYSDIISGEEATEVEQ